jgi:hypothetical protein
MKKKFFVLGLLFLAFGTLSSYGQNETAVPNPLVTSDQVTAEQNAAIIVVSAPVQQAKAQLAQLWLASFGAVSSEQLELLEKAVDEMAFTTAIAAQNSDPNYPKALSILAAPHRSFGADISGSRSVFDNPDTTYRPVFIDPSAHYVITGKVLPNMPLDVNFSF